MQDGMMSDIGILNFQALWVGIQCSDIFEANEPILFFESFVKRCRKWRKLADLLNKVAEKFIATCSEQLWRKFCRKVPIILSCLKKRTRLEHPKIRKSLDKKPLNQKTYKLEKSQTRNPEMRKPRKQYSLGGNKAAWSIARGHS